MTEARESLTLEEVANRIYLLMVAKYDGFFTSSQHYPRYKVSQGAEVIRWED
jgi:hypothetical protein